MDIDSMARGAMAVTSGHGAASDQTVARLHVGYLALPIRTRRLAIERSQKVRYLPRPGHAGEPQLLLHRSAN